ncbi:MAG: hypothetical protein IJK96_02995 [Bacteroidales bacterium]|nr:hypothetical protein [Bacteroidales bacterium]
MSLKAVSVFVMAASLAGGCYYAPSEGQYVTRTESFREAVPVWAEGRETEKNVTLSFRKVVEADNVESARVRLAASCDYRLLVNGVFVSHGPAVAAHGFYRVDDYDIAPFLKNGKNVVGIEVAGYNEPTYYLLDQPSFLQAEVIVNGKVVSATGKDIAAWDLGQRRQDVEKFSFQRPFREEYSLSPDFREWAEDAAWTGPGEAVLVPQPEKNLIGRGVHNPDFTQHSASPLGGNIWKFSCNSSGFLCLAVKADSPSRIEMKFDELLGRGDSDNLGAGSVIWNLEPGRYILESFEPYTMQYVQALIEGNCTVRDVWMRDYCNPDVGLGTFSSTDPGLDRIFEAARETIRQNSTDIFTDCPGRERAGWLCDSFFTSRVACDLSGTTLTERNFIENFLLPDFFPHIPEGMLPMCYPSDHVNENYIPNWAMWFVLELEEYLQRSGDRAMVERLRDRVYALVDFFKGYENSDGLLEKLDKWVFVEWSAANDYVQDVNYPSNMVYAYMLDVVSRLYGDASLHEKGEAIRKAVREQSFDGMFFRDHAIRQEDGTLVLAPHHTEVCQYYAFYFGTADAAAYPELWKTLRDDFGPKRKISGLYPDVPFANAFVGNYLRMELLSDAGLCGQIIAEARDFYLPMAEATGTLWENMTPSASCDHGFASHLAHVSYRDVLGLWKVDRVGKKLTLRFLPTGIEACRGSLPVKGGSIDLAWSVKDGKLLWKLDAPRGWKVEVDSSSMDNERI